MRKLFVYEYASAQPASTCIPDSVRREGRAMLDALLRDSKRLNDLEVRTIPDASERESTFRSLAVWADHSLILAPEFDGILELKAQTVLDAGGKLLGPGPDAIRLCSDKYALFQLWNSHGLPTPETFLPSQLFRLQGVRFLRKHRFGAGSLGINFLKDPVRESFDETDIIQAYVPGQAASVALLIDEHQRIFPLLPAWQHLSEDGRFSYQGGTIPIPDELAERVIAIAQQAVQVIPGLTGYIGVDVVLGSEKDYVIEVNPRVTTSYLGLKELCTGNILEQWLNLAQHVKPQLVWKKGQIRFDSTGKVCQGANP